MIMLVTHSNESLGNAKMLSWWPAADSRERMAAAAGPHRMFLAAARLHGWCFARIITTVRLGALRRHERLPESSLAFAAATNASGKVAACLRAFLRILET